MGLKGKLLKKELLQYLQQGIGGYLSYSPPPIEASLFLTNRCNSRCSMCDFWKNEESVDELTTDEILNILKQLHKMGVVILSLSAEGEITLRKDLGIIMEYIHEKFLYSLNSNFLVLSDKMVDLINKYPPYQITVGLDTLDDDKYQKIRGIENGASKVLSNIKKLQISGYANIAIGSILLNNNMDDIAELVEYVRNSNLAGIRFTAFQHSGFGKAFDKNVVNSYCDKEYIQTLKNVVSDLLKKKKTGYSILNSRPYLEGVADSYLTPSYFPITCRAPKRRIHIYSNGGVSLCQVMGEKALVGNVREKPLKEIWYSESSKSVREVVKNKGCGGCWLSCYAETNLRFTVGTFVSTLQNSSTRFLKIK